MAKQLTRLEVDGSIVEVKPIPLEVEYRYSGGSHSYRQRPLYEVHVDGVHRGYVYFPKGWGGCWHALSLRPKQRYDPIYHKHDQEDRDRYGLADFHKALTPGALNEPENWGEYVRRWEDRNAILAAFPQMIALGRCPTPAQAAAQLEQDKRDYAARKAEEAASDVRRAQEREEQKRRDAESAARAEEQRQETLAGLESMRDRLGRDLSNLEMVALTRAIERFEGKKNVSH